MQKLLIGIGMQATASPAENLFPPVYRKSQKNCIRRRAQRALLPGRGLLPAGMALAAVPRAFIRRNGHSGNHACSQPSESSTQEVEAASRRSDNLPRINL